jgi:hypothetical protein
MERHSRRKVWHGPDKLAPYDFLTDDLLGRPLTIHQFSHFLTYNPR